MPASDTIREFQQRLGYEFRDPALLHEALTHGSYLQDNPQVPAHNQRLEFLGDSVLQFVLTDALFKTYTTEREGVLSRRRAILSRGGFLTQMALKLGLDAALQISKSEEESGGRTRASILEDAFEALVGAIYLDSDLPTVRVLVLNWYGPLETHLVTRESAENPKGRLQELVQPHHGNSALRYEVIDTSGPKHAREYAVAVYLLDRKLGEGRGSSKVAEETAAQAALKIMQVEADAAAK